MRFFCFCFCERGRDFERPLDGDLPPFDFPRFGDFLLERFGEGDFFRDRFTEGDFLRERFGERERFGLKRN